MDFAKRAYDHTFHFDPIVRSLLDVDFYKLLMQQFIWERYPNDHVKWKVTNRTKSVRIADEIDINELRAQLDHARTLRFQPNEIIWLRGQTFYGRQGIFSEGYLNTLVHYQLPEYELVSAYEPLGAEYPEALKMYKPTGQFELTFDGPWWMTTLWETIAMAIINELRTRSKMKLMNRSQIDITYARAKVKLYAKLEKLNTADGLNITDFGTRRRHSFLWQEHCVLTAKEVLGDKFTGTSNVYLAMKHGLEAKGTNAHELPMVFAALARKNHPDDSEALRQSQYEVLRQWQNMYHQNLLVFLPDTFGTTQFLKAAPDWVCNWTGARPDSKDAFVAGEELIDYWNHHCGLTPEEAAEKLIVFSDGLDVEIDGKANGTDIISLLNHFSGRAKIGFGWGTNLTNDFIDCCPFDGQLLKSISLVCKVYSANGQPAVKMSDNYEKATGPAEEVEIYRNTFGLEGLADAPVSV
jgi:nicotinate phosphoribosyltransferase